MPRQPRRSFFRQALSALALASFMALAAAPAIAQSAPAMATPITKGDLDPAAFVSWNDGRETAMEKGGGGTVVLWTGDSQPRYNGVPEFADGVNPGPRHLRIGFNRPIPMGTVLVAGNCSVSALKADANYPGDLGDEKNWTPAERLSGEKILTTPGGYAVWTLPPGTLTRALRFTHVAATTDRQYAGSLGGAFVLEERLANLAGQARAYASANEEKAGVFNDGKGGTWGAWDNWDEAHPPGPIAETQPWVMLVWPREVEVRSLAAIFGGFGAADVQAFVGPTGRHPRSAGESDWKTVRHFEGLSSWYPLQLPVQWLDLGETVKTRAIRVKMLAPAPEGHPHIVGRTQKGRRVWLDELLALSPLGSRPLASAVPPAAPREAAHAPIPVRFKLDEPGLVTLVIDDAQGKRVRNLLAQTPFPKGENVAWWDGMDDLGRDVDAAKHGLYHVPGALVRPGEYRVRGLTTPPIRLNYEFSIYTAGNPAWNTADHTGAWLSNHSAPGCTLFVPADRSPTGSDVVYIGSHVSEGTDGLAWVDLNGKKQGGVHWVGGTWTGAQALALDAGQKADRDHLIYVASVFEGELRLTAMTRDAREKGKNEKSVFKQAYPKDKVGKEVGGLAARDGTLAVSLPSLGKILYVNVASGKVASEVELDSPRGLAFDAAGRLLAVSGNRVVAVVGGKAEPLPITGLEDPHQLTLGPAGEVYVTDDGASHQVKIFAPDGKALRVVGLPGAPAAGPYEPRHMNHPRGITLDSRGRLWVAECDEQPKRVSVWAPDGALVSAFYGPAEYGGGGTLDPYDPSLFHYKGMTFQIDWKTGENRLTQVYWRPPVIPKGQEIFRAGPPQFPHLVDGRRYFSNTYNSNPTSGASVASIWILKGGVARPVASIGRARDWGLLKTPEFRSLWPEGVKVDGDPWRNAAFFTWSDLNDDGAAQPEEVRLVPGGSGSVTIQPDLSAVVSRLEGKTLRLAPTKFTAGGAPVYDLAAAQTLVEGVRGPASSGGDQAIADPSGWTVLTLGAAPFHTHSLTGFFKGEARWSYPNLWPGLHASHEAMVPNQPGMIVGVTRLLGPAFLPGGKSDAGPLWCVNGNMGCMYVFTLDGLFVTQFFKDVRLGLPWSMPRAERGMPLDGLSLHDENFWPSITQTPDGNVYLVDGARTSLVKVGGLDGIRRLPESTLTVTPEHLTAAAAYYEAREAQRQAEEGTRTLRVVRRGDAPKIDGKLDDWAGAQWATIDRRGTRANFNSDSEPYDARAAMAVTGDELVVAFRTNGEDKLLRNSGELPTAPFKTGGALDLMLSATETTPHDKPVAGDLRLVVTLVNNKPLAVLYRAVVPGTPEADKVPFSSPTRTIKFDKVEDVSAQVRLAGGGGNYELAVPLKVLGWTPRLGQRYRGDIGLLRGDGSHTLQRVYWSNKATAITADVPSEAELLPRLWGELEVVQ